MALTDAQFNFLSSLYTFTYRIGDALGSEDTSFGVVLPTGARTVIWACRRYLSVAYRLYPFEYEKFVNHYCVGSPNEALQQLPEMLEMFSPEVAYAARGPFDPEAQTRGAFKICLFCDTRLRAGVRVLFVFNRVET